VSRSTGPLKGRRVQHQKFGTGEIIEIRRGGREYLVNFDNSALRMWLLASETVLIDTIGLDDSTEVIEVGEGLASLFSDTDKQSFTSRGGSKKNSPLKSARKMIEAFRLGIVPLEEIDKFTFCREKEKSFLFNALNSISRDGGIIRMVLGEYGTGKSHFLEYFKHLALKDGWVVATTEFDQLEIRPQNPKSVYHALLLSLVARKEKNNKNIMTLLKEAIVDPDIYQKIYESKHPYITKLFEIIRHSKGYNDKILWQWFTGDQINIPYVREYCDEKKLPSFLPYYSTAPIVCSILSSLGLIFKMMGYKGLLLLFDESESISTISHYYKDKADNFIKGLKLTALGTERSFLKNENLAHPTVGMDTNYIFEEHSYLALVFAMTPRPEDSATIFEELITTEWQIELNQIERESFLDLFKKLIEIHSAAYKYKHSLSELQKKEILTYLFDKKEERFPTTRLMIKFIIEILDLLKYHPNKPISVLLNEEDDFPFLEIE